MSDEIVTEEVPIKKIDLNKERAQNLKDFQKYFIEDAWAGDKQGQNRLEREVLELEKELEEHPERRKDRV